MTRNTHEDLDALFVQDSTHEQATWQGCAPLSGLPPIHLPTPAVSSAPDATEAEEETVSIPAQEDEADGTEALPTWQQAAHAHPRRRRSFLTMLPSVVSNAILVLALLLLALAPVLVPLVVPSVTVTIIPRTHEVHIQETVTIRTDELPKAPAGSPSDQVPGRLLSPVTMSSTITVPTTGIGHQEAVFAHGTLVLYNAAPFAQTIVAGTRITSKSGVEIMTDQTATVPAGTYATNGQAEVSAHATTSGPSGNIPAGDLSGHCCLPDLLVQNPAPFTGGQTARDYQAVAQADLEGATSRLATSMQASITAALSTQARPGEALTPPACTRTQAADHPVGEEARTLTLTLQETCQALTYDQERLSWFMEARMQAQARASLGSSYALLGQITTTITDTDLPAPASNAPPPSSVTAHVESKGTWGYQLSERALSALALKIAGASRAEAIRLLTHTSGVQAVQQPGDLPDPLPRDPSLIHVLVLVLASQQDQEGQP